ncbi:MAG: nucleoside-diphosphate sugar epimerase/dehydratase [Gammaproteobacteria bacterium]|nr:nucleoside-diphosphate sugar epimerase/dehydratase [Gammaproteobacteria bacterium]
MSYGIIKLLGRLRTRTAAFTHDLLMIPVAWLGAYWLRFNLGEIPAPYLHPLLMALPFLVMVQGGVFWYVGLYRGVWRFASVLDLMRIVKATIVGVALTALGMFLVTRMHGVPRSVFPLYGLLLVVLLGGPRLVYRWIKDNHLLTLPGTRVLIVGAGLAGEMLVRDLLRNPQAGFRPVGFVDDDSRKKGKEIHHVRVLGKTDRLGTVVERLSVDLLLLAVPSATSKEMRRLVELCEQTGVAFRTLPQMQDLVSGRVTVNALREVRIEDLLGREPVSLDWEGIAEGVRKSAVMVTGAGGSIGSELCRQLGRLEPDALILVDNCEFALFNIERELRARFPRLKIHPCLADVRDEPAVEHVFEEHSPTLVFHAAAYKHVPMLQSQVREAVHNNVLGTSNLASAASRHGCESFVLISTDKAVHPTNVMGATKRVAEIICRNSSLSSRTCFVTVRFGNVLDSAGSVVPLFREQIEAGGPVTVTHPDVKRFFMTIPEACQLIMQATILGEGGEIFVLDMGEPVRIRYLAEQMILLSGKRLGEDIEIVYSGLRPGEKMLEALFHEEEPLLQTKHEKIMLAQSRSVEKGLLDINLVRMREACDDYDEGKLERILITLVPEYKPRKHMVQSGEVVELNKAVR